MTELLALRTQARAAGAGARLAELRDFVARHPRARDVRGWLPGWTTEDGGLAEYQDTASGVLTGHCYRDLGDVTPYLWLLDDRDTIDRVHDAAEHYTVGGLLSEDGRIRCFDAHDFVLSFYLMHCLTGERSWRVEFLNRCGTLRRSFFANGFPPAWVSEQGRASFKGSAFGFGLLELLSLAHAWDPSGPWKATVSRQLATISRVLERQPLSVMPRAPLRLFDRALFLPRPGKCHARLFKDNSNLVYALLSYMKETEDPGAVRVLRELLTALESSFFGFDDGWVRTELRRKIGRLACETPLLIGNAVAIDLSRVAMDILLLDETIRTDRTSSFVEGPLQQMDRTGLLPASPDANLQHVDMITDFVTASFLWLSATGETQRAAELVERGLSAVERHRTERGLATHARLEGPGEKICVKYNLLVLKLVICQFLLECGPEHAVADRKLITELFLIDR